MASRTRKTVVGSEKVKLAAMKVVGKVDPKEQIEITVMLRPRASSGTGEAAQGPTAAAIANAVADATGARLRELPLTRARIKAAIGV